MDPILVVLVALLMVAVIAVAMVVVVIIRGDFGDSEPSAARPRAARRTKAAAPPAAQPAQPSAAGEKRSTALALPKVPTASRAGQDRNTGLAPPKVPTASVASQKRNTGPNVIQRPSPRSNDSWLQSIRDTGPHRVERGSSRWIAGLAVSIAGSALVLSTLLPWEHATTSSFAASVTGLGSVHMQATWGQTYSDALTQSYASDLGAARIAPGALTLAIGAVLVAGGVYLWTAWRSAAAITAAVIGGFAFLVCLHSAMTVASTLRPMTGPADFSIGMGLLLACALTLTIAALGVTAFVLERLSITSRTG